jgi:photolyase PhrII
VNSAQSADHRIHAPADSKPRSGGEFVLYWMQIAQRAHDNFGLNFAIEQADTLGIPVLAYFGIRHDYPWASDRFHTWMLQGVVDLYHDFAERGIQFAFWLDRSRSEPMIWAAGNRERGTGNGEKENENPRATRGERAFGEDRLPQLGPLYDLAERAALVVTDFYPTFIMPRQIRSLRTGAVTPVIAVDSTTLVPMAYHTREYSTARSIRPVLEGALPHFLHAPENPVPRNRTPIDVGFEPVVPRADDSSALGVSIASLVASCDIDHTVGPSPMFTGGTRAGRRRLRQWLETGLPRYDDRSDPNKPEVVSRLSPWLHFGNLSIHEILLAAQEAGPATQYAKFLDEALTWREISHNFCYFNPKHRTVEGIPPWARQQLADHESDAREALYPLEVMEEARTGEPLWNAAQRAYLRDGWMHNYMRMLWGKTVLRWTRNAGECLAVLEHLNNKYSLDGRDPNSYGGIMWTFGKFDRPFYPRPVYGNVRYQSLKAAKDKFDVPAYIAEYEPKVI